MTLTTAGTLRRLLRAFERVGTGLSSVVQVPHVHASRGSWVSIFTGLVVGTCLSMIAYSVPYLGFYPNLPALGIAVAIEKTGILVTSTHIIRSVTIINLIIYPVIFWISYFVVMGKGRLK
jgi:hypothetical protein